MDTQPIVLVVDDDASNIQILATYLKDNYRLKVAPGGQQCLNICRQKEKPDLILLDIEMPEMDGFETCQALKQDAATADIPVIFLTARRNNDDEEKAFLLGAVDYITKPANPVILSARVNSQLTIKQQRDQLQNLALRDQLTKLYNRHYLIEAASHCLAQAMRHHYELSLLLLDIDHFKQINDTYGHPIGDSVISQIAETINSNCRKGDIPARFGGEEFIVLLNRCSLQDAERRAENLREVIARSNPAGIDVYVSIGVAQLERGTEGFSQLVSRADKALYQAKHEGRNRVVVSYYPAKVDDESQSKP